jgi:hypothetical protein
MKTTVDDHLSRQMDVTNISLQDLREAKGPLADCLQRILDEVGRPQDAVAGFTSAAV